MQIGLLSVQREPHAETKPPVPAPPVASPPVPMPPVAKVPPVAAPPMPVALPLVPTVPPVLIEPPTKVSFEEAPPVLELPPVLVGAPPTPVAPPVLMLPPLLEAPATLLAPPVFVTDVNVPPVPEPADVLVTQFSRLSQVTLVSQAERAPAMARPKNTNPAIDRVFIAQPFIRNHLECRAHQRWGLEWEPLQKQRWASLLEAKVRI